MPEKSESRLDRRRFLGAGAAAGASVVAAASAVAAPATGKDIAAMMIDFLEKNAKPNRTQTRGEG